jgi:hypothetical protein
MNSNLYDRDFHAWAMDQADKLKTGRLSELDIQHLIEEMESMGATERRETINRLAVLLAHLLKWKYQPERRGKSWRLTIESQRMEVEEILSMNPSLRPRLAEFFEQAYVRAVVKAAKETRFDKRDFPEAPPFTVAEALDVDFWPE